MTPDLDKMASQRLAAICGNGLSINEGDLRAFARAVTAAVCDDLLRKKRTISYRPMGSECECRTTVVEAGEIEYLQRALAPRQEAPSRASEAKG